MANNLTDVSENLILNHINLVTSWTPTTPLRVALYTVNPAETGGGTEVVGGSYARTTVTFGSAAGGTGSNNVDVTFPTATATWGTVTGLAIFDSAATPVMIWYGPLTASKTVDNGDTFKIPTGSLALSLN